MASLPVATTPLHLVIVRGGEPRQKRGVMRSSLITPIQEQTQESL